MTNLIKAETFKLSKSWFFWLLLLSACVIGGLYGIPPLAGYEVYVIWMAPEAFSVFQISSFAAAFWGGEFFDRTFCSSIFCGHGRRDIFVAKAAVFFAGMIPVILLPAIVSTAIAAWGNGFGRQLDFLVVFDMVFRLLYYIFWGLSMGAYALLAAVLVRDRIGIFASGAVGMYIIMSLEAGYGSGPSGILMLAFLLETAGMLAVAGYVFQNIDLR